jgi:HEAT repeat-containing protein 5
VYQEVVFAETMDLFDRMVLTESLGVQSIIVEIARNLCTQHPSSRQGMQTPVNGEALSEDIEQLFELTRIIVLVIAGLVPGLSDTPVSARLDSSDEAVGLVRTALQALVDVSEVFPSIIKTDLHATILHIFVAILGSGACQAAVVPQALPIFRRFVVSIVDEDRPETQSQLRNALGRKMIILRNAQKRETEASLPCEKNTMLAITILLTAAPNELPETDASVIRFARELCESVDGPMTSRVAAGCIRTLLLANILRNTLLPKTIEFLLSSSELEGIEESKAITAQTLSMYAAKVPPAERPAAISLFISTLLGRAINEGPKIHQETATRLLELASADAESFKAVVAGMEDGARKALERILKAGAGTRRKEDHGRDHEPTIALKMDFGG